MENTTLNKILKAKSLEEAIEIAKEDGKDVEEAKALFNKMKKS